MSRLIGESVKVCRKDGSSIAAFIWRKRLYRVDGVIGWWREPPEWWNGNRVVYVIMEDGTGVADVTVFGDTQEKCGQVLFREGWLMVRGKVQRRGPKALSIIADDLAALSVWQSHP